MRSLHILISLLLCCSTAIAQQADTIQVVASDSVAAVPNDKVTIVANDSLTIIANDSLTTLIASDSILMADTLGGDIHALTAPDMAVAEGIISPERFIPDPKKALWLAIVLPGAGQIYNRKYWKLPIIYGGFIGCAYALAWNGTMYRDYSQAYQDIMDNNPNTKSYENFLPPNYPVAQRLEYLQSLFKRKKDYFRRYRDLSIFCMIGVYLLSIVDAYVDAELSSFDISRDLTMKVRPAILNERSTARTNPIRGASYGVQCSLKF